MNKPSRRAVVRTGVWTVPAVATVAAAPAFAGTVTPPVTIGGDGESCKLPGSGQHTKDYRFTLTLTNTTGDAQTVTITSFTFAGTSYTPDPQTVVVPANSTVADAFTLYGFDNSSSNPVAIITYSVDGSTFTASVKFKTPINPCPDH
jgi:hypothetical protein